MSFPATPSPSRRNDDLLEAEERRQARINLAKRFRSRHEVGFTNEQLAEHYSNCIKLSAANKINAKNAFGLHLIDYMSELIKKKDSTFELASSSLDASVKIYAGRVDAIHSETFKVLSGFCHGAFQNKQGEAGGVTPDEEQSQEEDEDNYEPLPKRRRVRVGSLIENNTNNIDVSKFDLEFEVDPFFKQMSAKFDERGTAGLLLDNLSILDDTSQLVLDANTLICPAVHPKEANSQAKRNFVDLREFEDLFEKMTCSEVQICPTLTDFEFLRGMDYIEGSSVSSVISSPRHVFDLSAEPASIELEENVAIETALDDDDAPEGCATPDYELFIEDVGVSKSSADICELERTDFRWEAEPVARHGEETDFRCGEEPVARCGKDPVARCGLEPVPKFTEESVAICAEEDVPTCREETITKSREDPVAWCMGEPFAWLEQDTEDIRSPEPNTRVDKTSSLSAIARLKAEAVKEGLILLRGSKVKVASTHRSDVVVIKCAEEMTTSSVKNADISKKLTTLPDQPPYQADELLTPAIKPSLVITIKEAIPVTDPGNTDDAEADLNTDEDEEDVFTANNEAACDSDTGHSHKSDLVACSENEAENNDQVCKKAGQDCDDQLDLGKEGEVVEGQGQDSELDKGHSEDNEGQGIDLEQSSGNDLEKGQESELQTGQGNDVECGDSTDDEIEDAFNTSERDVSLLRSVSEASFLDPDNLVSLPKRLLDKINLDYAKIAKKINLKRLKSSMWKILTKPPKKRPAETDEDTVEVLVEAETSSARDGSVCGTHSFQTLCSTLPDRLPQSVTSNLSVPIAFVGLLHLANEKNLHLAGNESMSDITITQDS